MDLSWPPECATVCVKLQVLFVFQRLPPKMTIGEGFIASGHTLCCHREYSVKRMESRYSRVVFVCGSVSVCVHMLYLSINKSNNEGLTSPGPKLLC